MTLYINCCTRQDSRTDRLARALLASLGDHEELRLYDEPLRPLAVDCFGIPHVKLLTAEGLDIAGNDPEAILQRAIADYGLTAAD